MSLISYPRQEVVYDVDNSCDPAKITLTFRGTPTAPLAHSIDPPPAALKQPQKNIARKTVPKKEEATESPQMIRIQKKKENMQKRREEFLEKGVRTALYGEVEQKVQCACMSTDRLLVEKRKKLRELLLAEEVAYAAEYIAMCQQANANREEELRNRAFEIKTRSERERKEFAEQKLLEQKVQSCDAARPVLTQKILMEVKKDQLWQIKEKYALEEAKREEERMYHDLVMKNMLSQKENDEENAKLAWKKQKDAQKAFAEQMKWKQQKEEEEKQLKELERLQLEEEIRLIKEEKEKEKKEKLKKKAEMKAEIHELLDRERRIKEKRRREEEEIDQTFAELLKIEEEKEKRKGSSNKERLKREMDIFLESSRELKRQREEEERKFDQMLEELNEKKRLQKDAERRRLKAAREELFHNVLKGREEQIRAKRERERREEEQERCEIELLTLQLQQQQEIREEYERRCAEQREAYKCQLLHQIKEAEETKKRKKEEEEEYLRKMKAEEEREIANVKAILQSVSMKKNEHPMKTIVKEVPPKYTCPFPCPR